MPDLSDFERAQQAIANLFPGPDNLRLRESILHMHAACGQFKFLGVSLMEAVATAAKYTKPDGESGDREDWETYMYGELNDALLWLTRLEQDILDVGVSLRLLTKARSDKKQAARAAADERTWAKKDAIEYTLHLVELGRQEESADGSGRRRPISGSDEAAGGGSGSGGGGSGRTRGCGRNGKSARTVGLRKTATR